MASLTVSYASMVLLVFSLTASKSLGQLEYPLKGRNWVPEVSAKIDVQTSAYLERILDVDFHNSLYKGVWWVVLAWKDPTAAQNVLQATARAASANDCAHFCEDNGLLQSGCCDTLWLPHVHLPNLIEFPEDQPVRYRIKVNHTTAEVRWSTRVVGIWYTPFDFRAYPFDHQHLLLEMQLADVLSDKVGLKWDIAAMLNNTPHTRGAIYPGWNAKFIKGKVYDARGCHDKFGIAENSYVTTESGPASLNVIERSMRYASNNTGKGHTTPEFCSNYKVLAEEQALFGPIIVAADMMMRRTRSYYILVNVVPVLLLPYVVIAVLFFPPEELTDRLGVLTTLFLSLTALQFVFDFPPSTYLNALQQVSLIAYILIFVVALESLLVHVLVHMFENTSRKATYSKRKSLLRLFSVSFQRKRSAQEDLRFPEPTCDELQSGSEAPTSMQDESAAVRMSIDANSSVATDATIKLRDAVRKASAPGRRLWRQISETVTKAPDEVVKNCMTDSEYARYIANHIDWWTRIFLFIGFTVTVPVLLWYQAQIGDHKLMLKDGRPANQPLL